MRRKALSAVTLTLALLGLTACGPGKPWGSVAAELRPGFNFNDRLDTTTLRFKTSSSLEVELESLKIDIDAIRVTMKDEDESAAAFDPAKPPAGYSLCHQGHCHADDGRLVSYKDVAREMASGGAAAESATLLQGVRLEFALPTGERLKTLRNDLGADGSVEGAQFVQAECATHDRYNKTGRCDLKKEGDPDAFAVLIKEIDVKGKIYDPTPQNRLPASGASFNLKIPIDHNVELIFKDDQASQIDLKGTVLVKASILDQLKIDSGNVTVAENAATGALTSLSIRQD